MVSAAVGGVAPPTKVVVQVGRDGLGRWGGGAGAVGQGRGERREKCTGIENGEEEED